MRTLVILAMVGCGGAATTGPTEMPLPGETSPTSGADEPDFRLDPAEHPGKLTEEEIDAVIQAAQPDITGCYERVLATSPEVAGTANTIFIIGSDGRVTAAASSGIDPRLGRCIDDVMSRRTFPPPHGGTIKVRYPFTFTSVAKGDGPRETSVTLGRKK
jgi:hypothetical protein